MRAKYSDGTDRDVTGLAVFLSSNDNAATVSKEGKVTAANRGEAFIMARYEKQTVGVPFIVLPKGLEFQWKDVPANNYIDELIYDKLQRLRIQPSELCTDAEYHPPREPGCVRRVAHVGRNRAVPGRRRPDQTRKARRYAARAKRVRRAVGDEMERAAANSLQPYCQLQGDALVLQLAAGADRRQRADR